MSSAAKHPDVAPEHPGVTLKFALTGNGLDQHLESRCLRSFHHTQSFTSLLCLPTAVTTQLLLITVFASYDCKTQAIWHSLLL